MTNILTIPEVIKQDLFTEADYLLRRAESALTNEEYDMWQGRYQGVKRALHILGLDSEYMHTSVKR